MTKLTEAQKVLLFGGGKAEKLPPISQELIHDSFFEGADNIEITAHAVTPRNLPGDSWNHVLGLGALHIISSSLHYIYGSVSVNSPLDISAGVSDNLRVSCEVVLPSNQGSDSGSGPFLRGAPNNFGIRWSWRNDGAVELKQNNGVVLGFINYQAQPGDIFLIRARGTNIQGWINGELRLERESSFQQSNTDVGLRFIKRAVPGIYDIIEWFRVETE